MCVIDNYSILRTHVLAQSSRLILNLSFPRKLPSRYPSPRVNAVTLLFAHRPVFLLSCTECQTCVSAELSELVYLVFATELTGTKGKNYPFFVYRPVILLPFLVFATELTCTKTKKYPFYVHRPVLFSVLHCIADGTKGKRSPFYVHRPVCLISTYTGTITHTGTNRLGRYPQRDIEQRYGD